jgi:hypothetical protein
MLMELNAETLDYYGLLKSYDEGCLNTSQFVQKLFEKGWFDRYLAEFIEMVNFNMPSFEKAAS